MLSRTTEVEDAASIAGCPRILSIRALGMPAVTSSLFFSCLCLCCNSVCSDSYEAMWTVTVLTVKGNEASESRCYATVIEIVL